MPEINHPLKVFLSYASQDKPIVRELSRRLVGEGWIDTWQDEKNLLPGQDWRVKIEEAVEEADVVIICLSQRSVSKEGNVQKELRYAREIALEKPEDAIFLIPLRLDECGVPRGLRFYQWADYFGEKKESTYKTLLRSLKKRHQQKLLLEAEDNIDQNGEPETELKELESQAIRYELMGDFWNARKTWYAIKQIAPLFPRVDVKIRELEREVVELVRREKAERESVEKASYLKNKRQVFAREAIKKLFSKAIPSLRIIGAIGIIAALFWAGSRAIPKFNSLIPTIRATATSTQQRPIVKVTSASPSVAPSKTLRPTSTPTKTRTPAPTTIPTEITDAKGVSMVLVPEGEFMMGNDNSSSLDERPAHELYLDVYYIDKYEVTNAQYKECAQMGGCVHPWWVTDSRTRSDYYVNTQYKDYPMIFVNWDDANNYCKWRGARLPTEAEWEKSARGNTDNRLPWGGSLDCKYANTAGCNEDTVRVGSYEDGKSIYGVYDLAGNVAEWVADYYWDKYYSFSPSINPQGPSSTIPEFWDTRTILYRVVRGGSWYSSLTSTYVTKRTKYIPATNSLDIGFRCARDIKP